MPLLFIDKDLLSWCYSVKLASLDYHRERVALWKKFSSICIVFPPGQRVLLTDGTILDNGVYNSIKSALNVRQTSSDAILALETAVDELIRELERKAGTIGERGGGRYNETGNPSGNNNNPPRDPTRPEAKASSIGAAPSSGQAIYELQQFGEFGTRAAPTGREGKEEEEEVETKNR